MITGLKRDMGLLAALGLVLLVGLFLSLLMGEGGLDPDLIRAALSGKDALAGEIVLQIRLPRALTAALVGALLGLSGAVLQGLLRNPLADPGVLGISSAAGLGAALAIVLGFSLVPGVTEGFALCFALGFALLLSLYTLRHPEPEALILFGVAASSLGGALTALVYNLSPSPLAMAEIMGWMMGSVENRHMGDVLWAALALLAGGVLAAFCAPLLRLLSLGEETAASSALSVRPLKMVAVLCASLCASVAVAVAGMIGFIGLAAPHMVRPFVGQDPARVLAPSALFGAVFVVLADCLVRVIPTEAELKLGVLSALVGAPIFGLLAWRAARSWRS